MNGRSSPRLLDGVLQGFRGWRDRVSVPAFMLRRSLRETIAVVFSLLILVLGISLILFSYERHRQIAVLTADRLFERSTAQVASNVNALYAPAETLVNMSATLAGITPDLFLDEDARFAYLVEALGQHPGIEAAYAGFDDGEFFLVRDTYDSYETLGMHYPDISMPPTTRYVAQSVTRGGGHPPRYESTFHDVYLEQLGSVGEGFHVGYDPRKRDWYRRARASASLVQTDFYTFFTTRETGTTIARRVEDTGMVFGVDITLKSVSDALRGLTTTESSEVVIFTANGKLLGSNHASRLHQLANPASADKVALAYETEAVSAPSIYVTDFDEPVLDALYQRFIRGNDDTDALMEAGGTHWFTSIRPVSFGSGGDPAFMAIAVPEHEMLSALTRVRAESAVLALLVLGISLLVAWWLSKSLAVSATRLAAEAREMSHLRFDAPITVRSRILEIDALARSMSIMKAALQRFARVATALSAEQGSEGIARVAVKEAQSGCGADAATLLLLSGDGQWLEPMEHHEATGSQATGRAATSDTKRFAMVSDERDDSTIPPEVVAVRNSRTVISEHRNSIHIPLKSGDEPAIGVLRLDAQSGKALRIDKEHIHFVEALAAAAAVALRNRQLIEAERDTFDSLIRLLAAAIDAKSPYTGRHCQRVPVLTERLARAADASSLPAFRHFRLDSRTARELHVASWLHDCGKVTTPEYVVDKATKLETLHNRIHEIRTRFEVLWRDAEIDYLHAIANQTGTRCTEAKQALDTQRSELQADFTFLAACNICCEKMTPACIERVQAIAERTWIRHFDDTLGLSHAELERRLGNPPNPQPMVEPLLADRPEHRVERSAERRPSIGTQARDHSGFHRVVPKHEHDRGEIHNLTIPYGTLTPEERFTVKDHVYQTIRMLDDIPFPRDLARVPRIAGNHHEKLDGSGYPRGLQAADLAIEDRIMAIADVFEALTASDRPYRRAKSLSEALAIMHEMRDSGLICADLFDLFVAEGVHLEFAAEHLETAQIDLPRPVRDECRETGSDTGV